MPTQLHRNIALSTPLGDDVLVVSSVSVQEQLGRLFQIDAELYGTTDVQFDAIVGQNATFRFELGLARTRYFNGFVSRFVQTRVEGRHTRYHATFVPWLWFLTRTADCRIFQQKKTPDIISEVFRGHGFSDFRLALSGTYETWEYCVQYRETDFNFVSRLMEQAGIYYFFEHENGKHTLVLADAAAAHKPAPGYDTQIFRPPQEQRGGGEFVDDWVMEKNLVPGIYAHTDYDFENPKKSLRTNSAITPPHAQAGFEIFDYPGEFKTSGEGDAVARVRIEELHTDHELFRGHANARGLATGWTFNLTEHPRPDLNRNYLVTSASYHIRGDDAEAGGGGGGEFFTANLTAIDATRPFRPARATPKPVVQGLQTAVVVGPAGEEIHTDKYGRVKVQFFWDRYGKANENSSCWIRVSQGWAGKKWGAIYIPRIGQEVIVEFLEGDPDRPIITGRVYNGDAMPPYDLPGEKTKSTLKSNSTKGGDGFNEIRFEDKKGKEQIFIHGQHDLDVRVRNNVRETNYGNRDVRVGWEKDGVTGGNFNTLVRKDVNTHVKGGRFEEIEKQVNQTVKEDVVEDFQKNQSTFVKETLQLNAKEIVIEGATAIHEKSGKIAIEGAQSVHIKGATVAIEGSLAVSLKVGGNFVSVNPAGVAIKGSIVLINSGGAGVSAESAKAAVSAEMQAPLEARPADTGKTGEVTKTSAAPITAAKRVLTSQKAPRYVPLPITPATPLASSSAPIAQPPAGRQPATGSCTTTVEVTCEHNRKAKDGLLQVVPEGKRYVTHDWNPLFAELSFEQTVRRNDRVCIEVKHIAKGSCQCQPAIAISGAQSGRHGQPTFTLEANSASRARWWLGSEQPLVYEVAVDGCEGQVPSAVRVEVFPPGTVEVDINDPKDGLEAFHKFLEYLNEAVSFLNGDKPEVKKCEGHFKGSWGWIEDKDHRAYFKWEVEAGADPIIGFENVTVPLVRGVPPFIPAAITKHVADLKLYLRFDGGISFTLSGRSIGPGPNDVDVGGKLTATLTVYFGIEVTAGSKKVIGVQAGGRLKANIEVTGRAVYDFDRGPGLDGKIGWDGLKGEIYCEIRGSGIFKFLDREDAVGVTIIEGDDEIWSRQWHPLAERA